MRHLLDERGLHARCLLVALIGCFQLAIGLLQTYRRLVAEIDDEHEATDNQYQCKDCGHIALAHQVRLLLDDFLLFLFCVIDGGQLHGRIVLHADNGRIELVTNLIAHLIGGFRKMGTLVGTVFGQQIVLDDVHRNGNIILLHLLVEYFKILGSLFPTFSRQQVVDSLQLALVGLDVVRLECVIEYYFRFFMITHTFQCTGMVDVKTSLLLIDEVGIRIGQLTIDVEQFHELQRPFEGFFMII